MIVCFGWHGRSPPLLRIAYHKMPEYAKEPVDWQVLWGCRKPIVFRAASRSKPRFRSNAEEKPRPPDTFFLPLYKNRGTRPRFLWICCANSILCVLSHEAQNRNLTFSTSWDAHRKMCVSVCQNVIFLQFIQFARQCTLKGLRSVKTTPHNENHSFLRRLRSRCRGALRKFCVLTLASVPCASSVRAAEVSR